MEQGFSLSKNGLRYGIYIAAALITYFLLMKVFNLIHVLELRFFNFFILAAGVIYTVRHYREVCQGPMDYLEGFGLGFLTSFVAGLLFSFFLFIYLSVFDTTFMEYLKLNAPMGSQLNPMSAAFGILIEATASGSVISLLALQYYRKPKAQHKDDLHMHKHIHHA